MNTQKQIFLIVVLSFVLVGGCAAYATIDLPIRAERQADFFEKESIERGALLYANNCRTCHGIQGEGGVGPPLNNEEFRDQSPLALEQNQEMIRRTITCGRAGTLMPAWLIENGGSLTENQIGHLVRMFTAPEDPVVEDGEEFVNFGWAEAVQFAHNLNAESNVVIGGDTLSSIAAAHNVGVRELAEANGLEMDAELEEGMVLDLPTDGTYEVEEGDTLDRIATDLNIGSIILAELNGLDYEVEEGVFVLTTTSDDPLLRLTEEEDETGLLPGSTLALPEGATYNAVPGDSLESIAEAHGISASELEELNSDVLADLEYDGLDDELPLQTDDDVIIELELELPQVDEYVVQGQTLDEAAEAYSNVDAESLAEANDIAPDAQPVVGKVLEMPEDAWGTAPPDTINDGSACVEHVVAPSIYDDITGEGPGPGEPTGPFDGTIVATGDNEFLTEAFALPPDSEVTVTLDNQGGLHNIAFFQSPTPGEGGYLQGCIEGCEPTEGDSDVRTATETAPIQQEFTFVTPAEAGEYGYLCEVHPTSMRGVMIIEEGAALPGEAAADGASGTGEEAGGTEETGP